MLHYDFEESIGYWVVISAHAFERALNEELAPLGITHRQFQVLAWLALEGDLSQAELAERMRIEAPTLAGILERMERDDWICRQFSPEDRRRKIVRPTPRVAPLWAEIVGCLLRVRARATQGLTPEQVETTMQMLSVMLGNLKSDLPSPPLEAGSCLDATPWPKDEPM